MYIYIYYIHIYWFFLVPKKVDRCFFLFFLGTCENEMATCHLQKYIFLSIFRVEGRAVFLVVFPKWQIQGLHRVKALVLSIEILCFHWKDLKSDFRKVSHWQFSVMFFGRSKNSHGFPQNSTIIFWKLRFYSEAFSSLLQNCSAMVCSHLRPVHLIGLEGSVTFLGLFISGTLTSASSLAP